MKARGMVTRGSLKSTAEQSSSSNPSANSSEQQVTLNKGAVVHYRTSSQTVRKDGQPIKRALLFSSSILTELSNDPTKQQKFVEAALNVMQMKDPLYRPAEWKMTVDGQYQAVTLTPSKTVLPCKVMYSHSHAEFSNEDGIEDVELKPTKKMASLKVKPPVTIKKVQELEVTPEAIAKIREYIRNTKNPRGKSQNSIVGGSANDYAISLGKFLKKARWEWLHLIAFSLGGVQGLENLVGGTDKVNSQMLLIEMELNFILKHYPEGFTLRVEADLEVNTEIALQIKYGVITKNFKHTVVFNAQDEHKPHRNEQYSFRAIFAGLIAASSDRLLVFSPVKKTIKKRLREEDEQVIEAPTSLVKKAKAVVVETKEEESSTDIDTPSVQWDLASKDKLVITPNKPHLFFYPTPSKSTEPVESLNPFTRLGR